MRFACLRLGRYRDETATEVGAAVEPTVLNLLSTAAKEAEGCMLNAAGMPKWKFVWMPQFEDEVYAWCSC